MVCTNPVTHESNDLPKSGWTLLSSSFGQNDWVNWLLGWGLPSPLGQNDWANGFMGWGVPSSLGQNDWVDGLMGWGSPLWPGSLG